MLSQISKLVSEQIFRGYNVSRLHPKIQKIFNDCNNVIEVNIPIKLENGEEENMKEDFRKIREEINTFCKNFISENLAN